MTSREALAAIRQIAQEALAHLDHGDVEAARAALYRIDWRCTEARAGLRHERQAETPARGVL